jgi:tRNA-2-methylthio-N6-dimethylallyladenosine synthase
MNERDSEAVAAQLQARGYSLTANEANADVVLLNTCSVRDAAEQKALGHMLTMSNTPSKPGRRRLYGMLGCMAQARGNALLADLPGVDLVLGTQKFHRAADYLDDLLAGKKLKVCDTEAEPGSQSAIREHLAVQWGDAQTQMAASISIMQGCNQHCTFCIVPFTRGMERSRPIEDILQEARQLARQGIKEILLLGQIVTSYGRRDIPERDGKSPFVQLLETLDQDAELAGLARIRFTAPHPKGYGDDLIEAYGRLTKLCPNAHLPIQSGSDRVLKLMHRGYNAERCLEIVRKLRAVRPGMGITTDLIVGFPGETEADFEETLKLVTAIEFDNAYVYKYSPRQDTPAATLPDQIPQPVKEERHARLLERINTIAGARYDAFVGRTVEVLVEGPSRRNSARWAGRTPCNRIVLFEVAGRQRGELLNLVIRRSGKFTLYGEMASAAGPDFAN